ncbi:MAG: TM1812 family CRISPR-associated protein [Oscillospiraceae bacterium]|nr:TM1812 family CRISPR-associated protein [Oscillospiraceae bacterium]
MKKFICVSPLQIPGGLKSGIYHAANNEVLQYNKEHSFPIIPVINGYADNGEEIMLITIITENNHAKTNYVTMKNAVDELAQEKNLKIRYVEISTPDDSNVEVQLGLFANLIDLINDNDTLYCDISYGTKVMNQLLTTGINYCYKVRRDLMIGCMAYGEMEHLTKKMKIYDITSLIYLDGIIRLMAEKGVGNPTSAIKMMMDWEDKND